MILQLLQKSSIYRWLWDSPTDPPLSSQAAAMWVGALSAVGSAVGLLITISLGTPSQYIINYVANLVFLGGWCKYAYFNLARCQAGASEVQISI